MHPGWKIAALLAMALFALGSLASGAWYLEATLPGGLPLGNALAALGFCAIAAIGVAMARRGVVRRFAFVALFAAAAWLPVSVAMAGNLALVFSGARGDAWIAWSAGVAVVTLASPVLASAHWLFRGLWPRLGRAPSRER
mgnify:CR=1 FL=1